MKSRRAFRPACRDKVVGWYPAVALPHRAGAGFVLPTIPPAGAGTPLRRIQRPALVTDRRRGSRDKSRAGSLASTLISLPAVVPTRDSVWHTMEILSGTGTQSNQPPS